MTSAADVEGALVQVALDTAINIAATGEPSREGLTWHADIMVGIDADAPVIGHGDVGHTLYDGTAGIALGLAACATVASQPQAGVLDEAARGAAQHAVSGATDMLDCGRLGLFDGATGVALGAATVGRLLHDPRLLDRAAGLADEVAARAVEIMRRPTDDAELDLIGGIAGTLLGVQSTMHVLGKDQPAALLVAGARRLADTAVPQVWGAAWPTGASPADGPPLLGLGHGSAGIALALAEAAAISRDQGAWRACAEGVEYERGWFDPDHVSWPDLRASATAGETTGWMAAWCHGALGIGLSRLRLAQLTNDVLMVAEASAALQAARDLVVSHGTAIHAGQTSDCTACHGLAGVVELLLVAARALDVPDHARAARRVARLMLEQRDAAGGAWPCGLPGAGEVPGAMIGTAGIALTLLRAAGASQVSTPLLPGPSGW